MRLGGSGIRCVKNVPRQVHSAVRHLSLFGFSFFGQVRLGFSLVKSFAEDSVPCLISVCRGRGEAGKKRGFCALVPFGFLWLFVSPFPFCFWRCLLGPRGVGGFLRRCFFFSSPFSVQNSSSSEENQHILDSVVCSPVCPCPIPSVIVKAWTREQREPVCGCPCCRCCRWKEAGARQRRRWEASPERPPGREAEPARGPLPARLQGAWARALRLANRCRPLAQLRPWFAGADKALLGRWGAAGTRLLPSPPLLPQPRQAAGGTPSPAEPRAGERPDKQNCLFFYPLRKPWEFALKRQC